MNKQITVIIPTHERHHVLRRAINYYSQLNVNIIIADSSNQAFSDELPINFKYLHCPDSFMGDKVYSALCEVDTDYSCLCADDDFLSESGLNEGLEFLKNNPDYVSVQGSFVNFYLSDSMDNHASIQGIFINFNLPDPIENCAPMYDNCIGYENISDSIEERLGKCFNCPQIYALYKTKDIKKCFEITRNISAITVVEMCAPLVSLCIGKYKALPVFWEARDIRRYSKYIDTCGHDYDGNKWCSVNATPSVVVRDWKSYFESKEGEQFKANFISIVSSIIPSSLEPGKLFDSAFNAYLFRQQAVKRKYLQKKIKNIIKALLPSMFVKYIQIKNRRRLGHLSTYPWNDAAAKMDWDLMRQSIGKYPDL